MAIDKVSALRPRSEHDLIMKRKLGALIEGARQDGTTLRRFQSLELHLLSCESLPELMQTLIYDNRIHFGWDAVSLILLDSEFEIQRLLEQSCAPESDYPDLFFTAEVEELGSLYGEYRAPLLGSYDAAKHAGLFIETTDKLASVGLLPLIRNRKLIGSLNLGSYRKDRFQKRSATDFLQHLAAIISVCVDMATVRERLKYLGLTDALTGVNNRRFFDQRLVEETARALRLNLPMSCLFIDIDHFKSVNDRYGHQLGDSVLQTVAGLIREQLRSTDIVARYGGEEFAVVLSQATEDTAFEIAERIRLSVADWSFSFDEYPPFSVSVSTGIARLGSAPADYNEAIAANQLIEDADEALYRAKRNGRNRVILASDGVS